MFGKVLYFDRKKINDYTAIITGEKVVKVDKIRISQEKGAGLKIPIVSGDAKASKEYEVTIAESFLYDVEEFERKLRFPVENQVVELVQLNDYYQAADTGFNSVVLAVHGFAERADKIYIKAGEYKCLSEEKNRKNFLKYMIWLKLLFKQQKLQTVKSRILCTG